MVGAAGSGRGQRGLALTVAHHGRAWRLFRVQVFSSHGGRFPMKFAPTGSQRWVELDKANVNRRRAATESSNGEVAQPVLGDGEGSLWWSFGSKDVRWGFLELPSSFSTDQLLWTAAETRIWWLPSVRRVLDLRPKIHTIGGAIYRGF
jgi:hypothetical protein